MLQLKNLLLRNRFSVLLATLTVYLLVLVVEGAITGREARVVDFENPFFDLTMRDFQDFRDARIEDNESDFSSADPDVL